MKARMKLTLLKLTLLLLLTACGTAPGGGDDGGSIEVTGWLERSLILTTTPEPLDASTAKPLTISGRPGAAPNQGRVDAIVARSGAAAGADVSSVGSFVLEVPVLLGDAVHLTYSHEGVSPAEVDVDVTQHALFPPVAAPPAVSAPDAHANVSVGVVFVSALSGERIFVSNHDNQHVAELTMVSTTEVVGHIPGDHGHTLLLYALTASGSTEAHHLTVP